MLEAGITNALQETCSCNISADDLEDSEATCSADTNILIFTTTVVYSTESGNLTASTLIQMFQDSATGSSISIGNQTATVTRVCSVSCIQQEEPIDKSAIVGAVVGAVLLVTILIVTAVVIW